MFFNIFETWLLIYSPSQFEQRSVKEKTNYFSMFFIKPKKVIKYPSNNLIIVDKTLKFSFFDWSTIQNCII